MKRALTLFFCCLFLPLIATPTLHDSEGNLLAWARQFIELFDKSDLEIQQGKERWELQKICNDQLEEALPLLK